MDNFMEYQKFFELRNKYPKLTPLISEIVSAFFQNNDSFPSNFFIYGTYDADDVTHILKEFGINSKILVSHVNIRKHEKTYIVFR